MNSQTNTFSEFKKNYYITNSVYRKQKVLNIGDFVKDKNTLKAIMLLDNDGQYYIVQEFITLTLDDVAMIEPFIKILYELISNIISSMHKSDLCSNMDQINFMRVLCRSIITLFDKAGISDTANPVRIGLEKTPDSEKYKILIYTKEMIIEIHNIKDFKEEVTSTEELA